ncbi:MAG: DUF1294 domain-containing protein [Clostridia bacterium]|nr:DUF1294 domain-containing protein [Clostridia bacterium]
MIVFWIYLIVIAVISLINFILYGVDKKKAESGAWRIPEKTLLGFSFFGGAAGGFFGMFTFRHKTKHWYFYAVNILGALWQVVLGVYLIVAFA